MILKVIVWVAMINTPVAATPVEPFVTADWESSIHGKMLRRLLPPGPAPETLPDPDSAGAALLKKYCVQCHYLPSPAMHSAKVWPTVVARMDRRMQGEGHIGAEMQRLMGGLETMSAREQNILNAYLQAHGQKPIDRTRFPDLNSTEGRAFSDACDQCHTLPDPKRHTADEWPKIIERMQKNLRWVGVVSASGNARNLRRLKVEEITTFLRRNSRDR